MATIFDTRQPYAILATINWVQFTGVDDNALINRFSLNKNFESKTRLVNQT